MINAGDRMHYKKHIQISSQKRTDIMQIIKICEQWLIYLSSIKRQIMKYRLIFISHSLLL